MLETRINNQIQDQQKENPENVGSKDLPQTLVSEIDETYVYAAQPAWRDIREKILGVREADREQTYKSMRRLLSTMRDSELNLLDPPELDALRRETAGEVLATGILDFALDFAPGSNTSRLVTPLIGSPAAFVGLRPKDTSFPLTVNAPAKWITSPCSMSCVALVPSRFRLGVAGNDWRSL
jgi:hypothetical protein